MQTPKSWDVACSRGKTIYLHRRNYERCAVNKICRRLSLERRRLSNLRIHGLCSRGIRQAVVYEMYEVIQFNS